MIAADKDVICGIYPKKEINWYEVEKAVKEGVPVDILKTRTASLVVNLKDYEGTVTVPVDEPVEIFNGGTGAKTEILKMAEIIKHETNSISAITFKPARNWDKVKDRMSNTSKSANALGYSPKVSIEEGLNKTIKWYQDNYDKVKSLQNYFE